MGSRRGAGTTGGGTANGDGFPPGRGNDGGRHGERGMGSRRGAVSARVIHVKSTEYFQEMLQRPDRAFIKTEWIQRVIDYPVKEVVQSDGRIRRWAQIAEMGDRYLRVVLLPDGETVHNAFFDRSFSP